MSIMDYAPRGLMEWAPVIGASAASGGAVLARMSSNAWISSHPEVTGWFASLAVAGGFLIAGRPGEAVAVALTGTATAAPLIIARASSKAESAAKGGTGYVAAEMANPMLGAIYADQLNGLGYATASDVPHAYGTVPGVAGVGAFAGPMQDQGSGAPINLLGAGSNHMTMAGRYGTTVMG